jgi:hypothetical protein
MKTVSNGIYAAAHQMRVHMGARHPKERLSLRLFNTKIIQ